VAASAVDENQQIVGFKIVDAHRGTASDATPSVRTR
jgi:hypothetical protein